MDKILTQQVGQQINAYFEEISNILLNVKSYSQIVKINNISKYLSFVNCSLDHYFSRIVHIYFFIDNENIISDLMYPFSFLLDSAKEQIKRLYYLSGWLMDGLDSYDKEAARFLGY